MPNVMRNIPPVNDLLDLPPLRSLVERANRSVVVSGVRRFLDNLRVDLANRATDMGVPGAQELAERIAEWIIQEEQLTLRPVINATGVLLHTGLGRAPLAQEALDAMQANASGYASVELDLDTGERSRRIAAVEGLLVDLTGAEAGVVVNNNAAATLLTLTALAADREVVASRGQLIEIGGSFRLPDVMTASGAKLREVGTTNKTRIEDYREAINQDTAALLRVHTSNFVVVGFTAQPTLNELVELGRRRRLPVIDDIGSGAITDYSKYGIEDEPVARDSIRAGADLVLFSGDKLLGGPQCGIVVGKQLLIDKLNSHPLMRALRVDKLTLAALAATLKLHRDTPAAEERIPLLRFLATPVENLRHRAERMAEQIAAARSVATAEPCEDVTFLGGGSVPTQQIPTWCVKITPARGNVDDFSSRLRNGDPPVVGRISREAFMLDLRTVFPSQDMELVGAISPDSAEA
jgi:L-seryl-tRNA(Ser) seleniumtransferase